MEFSIIIIANSVKGTRDTLNSLVKQSLDFDKSAEAIIINDTKTEDIKSVYNRYSKKYPNNIRFVENSEENRILAKKKSLKNAEGKFISVLTSGDTFSKHTFKKVSDFFSEHEDLDIVGTPIYFVKDPEISPLTNSRFKKTQVIDLMENPDLYPFFGPCKFVRKTSINELEFRDNLRDDITFLNEMLLENPHIGFISDLKTKSKIILEANPYLEDAQTTKEYYENLCENNLKYLITKSIRKYGEVPLFIQNSIANDIAIMLTAEHHDEILNDGEVEKFKESMKNILSNISDDVILKNKLMNSFSEVHTFTLKYGEVNEELLSKINLDTVFIDIYDIIDNSLKLLFNFPYIHDKNIDIFINDEKIDKKSIKFPQRDGIYFNYKYMYDNSFELSYPLSKNNQYKIEFKSEGKPLSIDFSRPCNFSRIVGYAKSKNFLSVLKENKIIIEPKTTLKWLKQEGKALLKMMKERKPGFKVGIPFRIMYMVGYPFLNRKRIWFYMDHPDRADDNGMHLFKYAQDKDKDIKKYFILDKNSKDLPKMKAIGKVLEYKSIKHRFLGMFVENIVTSHPDNGIIYPFWGTYPHIAGLLKSNTIFLQHGIIKDDISPWLNRFSMNLALLVTSSPQEYESIFENPYHYEEDTIQILGLPRYDNLKKENTKKQIFIMPSWRRPLTKKSKEYISKTEYFNRFNSLIRNEKMIKQCKKYGYEIIFKPHPNVYHYIDLYKPNDYVKIDFENIDYQEIFNNASLLITDYSSVAFDFAYLYKPILYYQYRDDYHFDVANGYFKYETMGFGEVCREEDEIVELICEYVENNCEIKDKYSKRISDFFYYSDRNNCKRVYEAIKKLNLKD